MRLTLHSTPISFQSNESPKSINFLLIDTGDCVWMKSDLYSLMNIYKANNKFTTTCRTAPPLSKTCLLSAYPNPSNGNFIIKGQGCFTDYYFNKGELMVISMKGEIVHQQDIFITDLNNGLRLNLVSIPQGTYVAHIQSATYQANYTIAIAR